MSEFSSARNIAHVLLGKYGRKNVTNELIIKEVDNLSLMSDFNNIDKDELIAQLEARFSGSIPQVEILNHLILYSDV